MSATPRQPDGYVVSWDPGIITGVAVWRQSGKLVSWANCDFDEALKTLHDSIATDHVYEDYRLRYGRKEAADSHHTASQLIGALKYHQLARCALKPFDVAIWPQEVEVLVVESLHLGLERPKNHKTGHYVDAILHGAYWLRRVGIEPDVSRLAAGSTA